MFAQQQIAEGEIILEEIPLVASQFSWNKAYGYQACEHCMYPLETAEQNLRRLASDGSILLPYPEADATRNVQQRSVQCQNCTAKFCSAECLAEAEKKYHKLMCRNQALDSINEVWK